MRIGRKNQNRGVTLIEVMIATLAVLVVIVGVMNFQYYCAMDAYEADVRVKSGRLGLVLLEGWKTAQGDVLAYDPADQFTLPPLDDLTPINDPSIPQLGTPFKYYRIGINGIMYFVTLSYDEVDDEPSTSRVLRKLNVAIAWSRDYGSETLTFELRRFISLTKYANYIPLPPS